MPARLGVLLALTLSFTTAAISTAALATAAEEAIPAEAGTTAEATVEATEEAVAPAAPAEAPAPAAATAATPLPAVAAEPAAKPAELPPKVSIDRNGLVIKSGDGRYSFDIGGRVHVDYSNNIGTIVGANDPPQSYGAGVPINGVELRRARIETSARMAGDFFFVGNVDFGDNKVGVKDFFVGYDGLDHFSIMIGDLKQPYSLVIEESSNDMSFMERGIDSFLLFPFVDRAIGVRMESAWDHFFFATSVTGGTASSDTTTDGWGVAGRAIWSPILTDDSVLHIGFRTAYRQPSPDAESVRLQDETTHHSSLSIVDTGDGSIDNFQDITLFGPEAAYAWRFVTVRGEYNYAHMRRRGAEAVSFQSGYVSVGLALTGQNFASAYKMSAGEFRRLENVHDFDPRSGHWGGLELASRWSFIDLEDADVIGGREQAISTDLIWSLNFNVRLMFDWTHIVKTEGPAWNGTVNSSAEGLNVVTARAQFAF